MKIAGDPCRVKIDLLDKSLHHHTHNFVMKSEGVDNTSRQFIHSLVCENCQSRVDVKIRLSTVRGRGLRNACQEIFRKFFEQNLTDCSENTKHRIIRSVHEEGDDFSLLI
jgi:hypothetical protein